MAAEESMSHDQFGKVPWIYGPAKTIERHPEGGYTSEHKEGWRIKAVPPDQVSTPQCSAGEGGINCGGAQGHEHPHVLMMDYRVGSIAKRGGSVGRQ
jgi:hypothetical protein